MITHVLRNNVSAYQTFSKHIFALELNMDIFYYLFKTMMDQD
jgi:hypothetical protein